MEPLRFNSLVEAKEFTNGADKEDIGIRSMGRPSPQSSLRRALSLVGMGFGDEHAKEVLEVAGRFART